MPTVVIPAYNEGKGIARCLRAVLADEIADLTVVVIPNACKDNTADEARAVPAPARARVLVVETAEGGKTNAINLGELALREAGADTYPRLFLDGDIEFAAEYDVVIDKGNDGIDFFGVLCKRRGVHNG